MLDIDIIRKTPDVAVQALARRGFHLDLETFKALDDEKKQVQQFAEKLLAEKNQLAEKVARAKKAGDDIAPLVAQGEALRLKTDKAREALTEKEQALQNFVAALPNLPAAHIPDGDSDVHNVVLRQVGQPALLQFAPATHDQLGASLKGLDFDVAAQMSGARFAVAKGPLARLHRALIQFMLDTHVDEHGYVEVQAPYLVKEEALFGTGQLPKFEEDLFKLERDKLYLIPTAEVPVTNLVANTTLKSDELPLAFTCHTPCFRREAGSAGRDMKGLIRQHQFEKVELVRLCKPENAKEEFDALLQNAEAILKKLDLPYRVVHLCAGDIGFSSQETVDLEVWMPGQNAWREISSVSHFGTFQARRMKAKFKDDQGKNQFIHTLNGSGLAAGRALVAVMENYQKPDGSIAVPKVLQKYMNGQEEILPIAPAHKKKLGTSI